MINNYRPVSVLPVISEIYERIMQKQILEYIDKIYLPNYMDIENIQTALIFTLGKWKLFINNKGFTGEVSLDLSKAFDTINHQLLLAKLHVFDSANKH